MVKTQNTKTASISTSIIANIPFFTEDSSLSSTWKNSVVYKSQLNSDYKFQ